MRNEAGYVQVSPSSEMMFKLRSMAQAIPDLMNKLYTANSLGLMDMVKTRKRILFRDKEYRIFDVETCEAMFPELFSPICFCFTYYDPYAFFAKENGAVISTTSDGERIQELNSLAMEIGCTMYLTPNQARLWRKIEAVDANLYVEAAR